MIGFNSIKSILFTSYQNQKLHHAILLHGKKGCGKASFAREFALEILKQNKNNHPDLLLIEKKEGKRDIVVDQVREISEFLNQTSAIAQNKFIIIDAADELNRNASNALLKILEEPHRNNFLILISHSLQKLLPTIKSRCQIIKIDDFKFDDFNKILNQERPKALPKLSEDEIKFLSEICDNSPALALKKGDDLVEIYQEFLTSLKNKKLSENILKKISEKNFDFEIITKVIIFFLYRFNLYNQGLVTYNFFDEKEIFNSSKFYNDKNSLLNLAAEIDNNLNKITQLNLDKKLSLINIFNSISIK